MNHFRNIFLKKGEMIYVNETGLMLFLGSPSVLNLEDLTRFISLFFDILCNI